MSKTEENADLPWDAGGQSGHETELRLVVVWSLDEPERLGESAAVRGSCVLGRGPGEDEEARLKLETQRPGSTATRPPLSSGRISRRQLTLEHAGRDRLLVRCVGQAGLLVNGAPVEEATVVPGDTLRIRNAISLLVDSRPASLASRPALERLPSFVFGHADRHGIVGETERAWALREQLAFASETRRHVLILGESGAGKELAARAIHAHAGPGPFVSRNAATFPSGIVDAELFGTAKGYPNAGSPERPGLVAEADGGSLFLDEIGELPDDLQARLLRFLDEGGEYQRLGDSAVRRSNLRVIAATNRPTSRLKHDVLARFPLRLAIPPLNARRADIPLIARALLGAMGERSPMTLDRFREGPGPRIDPALVEALVRHDYTHHARELEYLLFLAVRTSPGNFIALTPEVEAELSPPAARGSTTMTAARVEPSDRGSLDRATVEAALAACNGSTRRAAEKLGLPSRFALYRLMKRLGLGADDSHA